MHTPEFRVYDDCMKSNPSCPSRLERYRRYTVDEVALIFNLSRHYFYQCVRAARDEKLRKKWRIPLATLRTLPVRDWFKQGRTWMINETDLLRELR